MTKEELEMMLKENTPKELINKYIKNEITLTESQINKLIKMRGYKNERKNNRKNEK